MSNLKLCPFCGGEAKVRTFYSGRFVRCESYYASVNVQDTKEKAIAEWNTRTNKIPVGNGENYVLVVTEDAKT